MSPTYSVLKTFYDFIIIGAGNAGAAVGARLAENPKYSVLVLEAGPPLPTQPAPGSQYWSTPIYASGPSKLPQYIWNYTSIPQVELANNRVVSMLSGKVVGGTSNVNFMLYTRGTKEEYDRIARIAGDQRWSWDNIIPFAKKSETRKNTTSGRNFDGDFNPDAYGDSGPILISLPNDGSPFHDKVKQASHELGGDFEWSSDTNSGRSLGLARLVGTIGTGVRSGSSNYLKKPRRNLEVVTGARVTKILFSDGPNPAVTGVEFTKGTDRNAPRTIVRPFKEVILSAGAIGSPKILLQSGVGPKSELEKLGIKVVKDHPDVGRNLQDHALITNSWYINSNISRDELFPPPGRPLSAWAQGQWDLYDKNKTGRPSNTIGQTIAFFRLPSDDPIYKKPGVVDDSPGPNSPQFEFFIDDGWSNLLTNRPDVGRFITIATIVLSPSSRGSVTLKSSDPFDDPLIDPALLTKEIDFHILKTAIKRARELVRAPVFEGYIQGEWEKLAEAKTDEQLDKYIRENTVAHLHPSSTLAIGPKGSDKGVVNPDLTVKGIRRLRVVDASIFPNVVAAHPQIPVYAIAERASDIIKKHYQWPYYFDSVWEGSASVTDFVGKIILSLFE
ncbi:uncharacterized protein EI90DRAFT_3115329 [Cantharellus anzutake]|uniref:uncharacterized protein n=1 Tax=Cantharellus anzutake TaxID=1750568 RepID=UPI001905E958|nr:uncharacterized protein EI90DRAFT_3115329 [Cantharellus anzutake]KAF8342788.1 hypothetical protein EI90DRAFT_3115329 [Cantharellus anzutake]